MRNTPAGSEVQSGRLTSRHLDSSTTHATAYPCLFWATKRNSLAIGGNVTHVLGVLTCWPLSFPRATQAT